MRWPEWKLYINWRLIINRLFVEQTFHQCKSTSLPKILAVILLCGGDFQSCARQGKWSSFTDVHFGTSKVKQVGQILFCNNPIFFFFIIPKVCWTVCVFHFLNLESLRRIYVSLFTFRDFRHRRAMILTMYIKTLKNCGKEPYNVWMHFSPSCCQKCECKCCQNDLLPM